MGHSPEFPGTTFYGSSPALRTAYFDVSPPPGTDRCFVAMWVEAGKTGLSDGLVHELNMMPRVPGYPEFTTPAIVTPRLREALESVPPRTVRRWAQNRETPALLQQICQQLAGSTPAGVAFNRPFTAERAMNELVQVIMKRRARARHGASDPLFGLAIVSDEIIDTAQWNRLSLTRAEGDDTWRALHDRWAGYLPSVRLDPKNESVLAFVAAMSQQLTTYESLPAPPSDPSVYPANLYYYIHVQHPPVVCTVFTVFALSHLNTPHWWVELWLGAHEPNPPLYAALP